MKKLSAFETKQALLHPIRINEISQYILNKFNQKTHRMQIGAKGFNAMFAVSSVDAAKLYYEAFKNLQKDKERPLKLLQFFHSLLMSYKMQLVILKMKHLNQVQWIQVQKSF